MAKRCIYCEIELSGNSTRICSQCYRKLPLVRKLLSMRLPSAEPKPSECVYCVDGICANSFNVKYAQPCGGDLLCKRGAENGKARIKV